MNIQIKDDEKLNIVNENIKLIEKKDGLTFGTDAYLLSAFVNQNKKAVAVDLGAGTGIISLLLAQKEKISKIYSVEVQKDFYELIEKNIDNNALNDKIIPILSNVKDLNSNLFGLEVDIVVSNPPYMKATSGKRNENDRKYIARHEIEGNIFDFCACASRILKFGGYFYVVYRPDRLVDLIEALRTNNLEPKEMLYVHSNKNSYPSMVLIKSKKGASASLKNLPPLFLNKKDSNEMSDEAKEIYSTCEIKR